MGNSLQKRVPLLPGDRLPARPWILVRWRSAVPAAMLAAVLLASCGGSDSPGPAASAAAPQIGADNGVVDASRDALGLPDVADSAEAAASQFAEVTAASDADEAKPSAAELAEWHADAGDDERVAAAGGNGHRHSGKLALVAGAVGGIGYADRSGSNARFNSLRNVTVGPDGAIYLTEESAFYVFFSPTLIRRIAHNGRMSTAIGRRDRAPCAPPGAEPPFDVALSTALDSVGNFYFAGFGGPTYESDWVLRAWTPGRSPTTLFGTFTPCGSSSPRAGIFGTTFDLLPEPVHVQVSASGDVYVGEQTSIRRISRSGAVTVVARFPELADLSSGPGQFSFAVDVAGNLHAAHPFASVVSRFAPDGRLLARFGVPFQTGSSDGTSTARFNGPNGITVDAAGNAYVADSLNHTIRKITRAGVVSTLAGAAGQPGREDGVGPAARLAFPNAIAFDPRAGRLAFTDAGNNLVRAVSLEGQVTTLAGSPPAQPGDTDGPALQARLNRPEGADADSRGNIYIAGGVRNTVRKLVLQRDGSRRLVTIAGKPGEQGYVDGPVAQARFGSISDIAVDQGGRVIYVADNGNNALRKIDANGIVTTLARFEAGPPPATPSAVVVLPDRSLLVSAPINAVIYRVTQQGEVTVFAGAENLPGSADGTRLQARFNAPQSMAIGKDGSVYVGDSDNQTIRKITRDGRVVTMAGKVGVAGLRDGVGSKALLGRVGDMAVDARGRVYFTQQSFEPAWSALRVLAPDGTVTTLVGDGIYQGVALGPARKAGLSLAYGVALVGDALYLTDLEENAVLKWRPR